MKKQTRLNEVFSDWFTGAGIFATLQNFNIPWKTENIADDLDLEYHGNISGDKIISPLVQKISNGETLTATQKTRIASAIYAINSKNWTKQWETLLLVYNPIENYRMTEIMSNDETITAYGKSSTRTDNLTYRQTGSTTETSDITDTRTDNLSHSKTGTESGDNDITDTRTDNLEHEKTGTETTDIDGEDTRTDNLSQGKTGSDTLTPNRTETTTPNLTNNNTGKVYGFNSSNPINADAQTQSTTGTSTTTHTGTEQTTYNTTETNTGTQTNAKDETQEISYNISETDTGTQSNRRIEDTQTTYNISESDTGTQTNRHTGEIETEYDLTNVNTGTQTVLDGGRDVNTRNYQLTRSGNIGVTTSQQMTQSERNLWIWNFFRNVVFPDIDKMLTIQVY